MNINFLENPSYTVYISSADRITGTNNNATFNIAWDTFLPREFNMFKVCYSFQTSGGYYFDSATYNSNFNGCKIVTDFGCKSFSYDVAKQGSSNTLGFSQRDIQTAGASSNSYATFFYQFPAKTINRPTQNNLTISIYNTSIQNNLLNQLLVTTSSTGVLTADMTSWNLVLEFIPVQFDVKDKKKFMLD
jgi:hypothetical protein